MVPVYPVRVIVVVELGHTAVAVAVAVPPTDSGFTVINPVKPVVTVVQVPVTTQ